MSMATTKKMLVAAGMVLLAGMRVGYAQEAPPPEPAQDPNGYFAQHFAFDALNPDVKSAIAKANLAPVPFNRIVLHTREVVTTSGQAQPSTFTASIVLENAGHGLVRRAEAVQDNGNLMGTRLDLTYRGYFSFLTQSMAARSNTSPPMQESRKILRFDTGSSGHFAMVYLYGATGQATFADPGQYLCDSGKQYSASQLNPGIEGAALEVTCRTIDSNGIDVDKVTLAYLEKYDVAIALRVHNDEHTMDSAILDFNAQ
ncbi:hypothetical protein DWU98_07750 [Dyella monticola]|uniref:Uncharacterized protein n=1 Tax=Dyella monticola TaxID=1927958 RepID=A0A370X3V2_9GAMM|nr:hypothetical protein [Dyella monticola]RDS83016.1 hypothetical protein DWU98_07750 [Dyella monticola]